MPPKTILNAPTKPAKSIGYGESYAYDHAEPDASRARTTGPRSSGRRASTSPPTGASSARSESGWSGGQSSGRAARQPRMSHFLVVFGAGAGGALRHGVNLACARACGLAPWGTLAVNISVFAWADRRLAGVSGRARAGANRSGSS